MGNAPICQACHSDKGLRTQGNIQDLDKNSDYYGCNSEESKEPQALVSLGWRKWELKGKIEIRVVYVRFEKDLFAEPESYLTFCSIKRPAKCIRVQALLWLL